MTRKMKWALASGLMIGVCYFWGSHHGGQAADPYAVVVEAAKVSQENLPLEAQTIGTLVAAQHVQIAPEVAGQVAQILFKDGTFVTKGTPLIQLNNAINKSRLDSAEADYNLSLTTYNRIKLLTHKGIISTQDCEKAEADLKEKKAAKEANEVMVEQMRLVAPFDGAVGKSLVSPGDFVSAGQALVSLTDTHHLHVEYNVSEKYLSALKSGQKIRLTTSAYPGREFTGEVAYIAPTINTQDRTISVYAEVPNKDEALTAGLFVNVTQALGVQDNVLLIPASSLMATIDGHQVMKIVDGKAVTAPVEIGQRTLNGVQIIRGLVLQDRVITAGQQKIRDGVPVKVKV